MRRIVRSAVLAMGLASLVAAQALGQVDLKTYVPLIEANYYEETRRMFESLATHFDGRGNPDVARFFASYAQGGGFGTGWVYVEPDGENFIVTNQHVVAQAGSVTVKFERPDGSFTSYEDAPIVYVDDYMDLAVVRFPDDRRVFDEGFPIDEEPKADGAELFSAGFPGFGGEPLWQFSTGIVTNARARPSVFQGYDYLIQHSAQIDPGNSGGPLMVRDPSSPTGFAVVGVNTWKATQRSNTNFSIPAKEIPPLIERARQAAARRTDPDVLREQLERTASVLAAELRSANPDTQQIHRFVSYALVGRRGWEAFQQILSIVEDPAPWERDFFNDPIETMRTSLYYLFWFSLGTDEQLRTMEFVDINPLDLERLGEIDEVRTRFRIADTSTEIAWSWEYGGWKIRDFELQPLRAPDPGPASPPAPERGDDELGGELPLFGVRVAAGGAAGAGEVYGAYPATFADNYGLFEDPVFNFDLGVALEFPVSLPLWLEAGADLSRKGRYYQLEGSDAVAESDNLWISERILYLRVPGLAKLRITPQPGLSFALAAGPALNLAVSRGGVYWDWDDNEFDLPSSWYDDALNPFALSALLRASVEIGLGGYLIGFDLTGDVHLTKDFEYVDTSGSTVDESSRFRTLNAGGYLRFPLSSEE